MERRIDDTKYKKNAKIRKRNAICPPRNLVRYTLSFHFTLFTPPFPFPLSLCSSPLSSGLYPFPTPSHALPYPLDPQR